MIKTDTLDKIFTIGDFDKCQVVGIGKVKIVKSINDVKTSELAKIRLDQIERNEHEPILDIERSKTLSMPNLHFLIVRKIRAKNDLSPHSYAIICIEYLMKSEFEQFVNIKGSTVYKNVDESFHTLVFLSSHVRQIFGKCCENIESKLHNIENIDDALESEYKSIIDNQKQHFQLSSKLWDMYNGFKMLKMCKKGVTIGEQSTDWSDLTHTYINEQMGLKVSDNIRFCYYMEK